MFLICSACGAAKIIHCYGFRRAHTIWTLNFAELSAFVDGPREFLDLVYGYERPSIACEASLTYSTSILLRSGALNLVARGIFTAEHYFLTHELPSPPSSLMTASVYCKCQYAKQMRMRCVFGGVCACLRLRAVGLYS
jgi:hypothetical protein